MDPKLFDQIEHILVGLLGREELFNKFAKVFYQIKESLCKAGFTEEQAIQVLCSQKLFNQH
jgi:hypothetical protein